MRHDRSVTATNHYLYNGKELNEDLSLDWYDYGFRWYDAELGRFPSVDPLSSRFSSESNYSYAGNSPTVLIDVDGKFKFAPQTLKILKEKYPTAYKYLVKTDINTPGNILSYANDMQIMSILIRNTNYYHCTLYWDNHIKEGKPITNKMAIDMMSEKEQILKEGDILKAFTYGNGPEIKIGQFPNCIGGYNNGQGGTSFSSALEIHPRYFEDLERASSFEDKQAALVNLVSIIFHEFTEGFADDRTDLFGTGEFGAAMAQYQIFADKRPGIYRDYDCEFDVNFQSAKTAIERLKECGNYYNPSFIPVLPK